MYIICIMFYYVVNKHSGISVDDCDDEQIIGAHLVNNWEVEAHLIILKPMMILIHLNRIF